MSYYCQRCDRWFEQLVSYRQHVAMSSRHYVCNLCNKDFDSWNALKQHYIQSPRHYFCRECDSHFSDNEALVEHCLEEHFYCERCDKFFRNAMGLHEHNRQSHHYCEACKRVFKSESNLREHLNSSVHRPKNVPCAFRHLGCTNSFVSKSAMILHLESGSCPSRVDRRKINEWVRANDRNNSITVPQHLLTNGDSTKRWIATERSWNSAIGRYECILCHNTFCSLVDLNRHLDSPRHQEKIYRCPLSSCLEKFRTLSGLCQHVESERCGVLRFHGVREGMDALLDVSRLRIRGESVVVRPRRKLH